MKVVQVITGDEGGGGRAAYRLSRGLNLLDCDSSLYVASKFHPDPSTVVFRPRTDPRAKLGRLLFRMRARARELRAPRRDAAWSWDHECQRGNEPLEQLPAADVYNAHTVTNFFNYSAFWPAVTQRAPVVWTLHLTTPFTGGCYYSYGCEGFHAQCGACPMLHSAAERDLSRAVWKAKERIYAGIPAERLRLVCPSQWIHREVSKSSLLGRFPATTIPYGLDTEAYAPRDRAFARQTLGIPPRARVLLFATQHSLSVKFKGFELLVEALRQMRRPQDLHLITLGQDCAFDIGAPHRHFGHIFDDHVLSLIYSAADLFIIPSLQDNLPNVILESIACGTPVVGFATGGIPEMVRKNETGELAPPGDVRGLRTAIEFLLSEDSLRENLSRRCREVALREYSLAVQAERYLKIYREMLRETGPAGAGSRKSSPIANVVEN